MAKKVDIGSKEFTKLICELPYQPNRKIIKRIDSKMFSLDGNAVYNYKPEYLAGKEFRSASELFQRRFGDQVSPEDVYLKVLGLFEFIGRKEAPFVEALQQLAVSTIKELYDVPDHLNIQSFIENRIDLDTDQDNNPTPFLELTLEQKNSVKQKHSQRINGNHD